MPTDIVKFPVYSVRLLRKSSATWLAVVIINVFSSLGEPTIRSCDPSARDPPICVCVGDGGGFKSVCVCVCVCVCACVRACVCLCARARVRARRCLSE